MSNLTKIVECASQQAFDNIPQKDETVLYLTPENTISIQAGNGIEVEKTTDAEGNEIYTVSTAAPPALPTNFIEAYEQGYNFNGKTITFESADYNNEGYYKILLANGYYIHGSCDINMQVKVFGPYMLYDELELLAYELPQTFTFRDGVGDIGTDATVQSFWWSDDKSGAGLSEVTPEFFAQKVTINISVEE